MKSCISYLLIAFTLLPIAARAETASGANPIQWTGYSDEVFARAATEKKLIILDLEAVWCHWCHVMEKETYSNPKVRALINSKFIAVRVDQDSRPDLSTRYQDYGWPATIILSAKGEDLVKMAGFVPPDEMIETLQKIVKKPVAESDEETKPGNVQQISALPADVKHELIQRYAKSLDREKGGLNLGQRYLESDTEEYAISNGADEAYAKLTLDANRKIIDPVWGGVYQYSTDFGWDKPHFEKIAPAQTKNLILYSYAYGVWKNPQDLTSAQSIYRYVKTFLRAPEGAFYTSQDADLVKGVHSDGYFKLGDAERRKQGIPVVDTHVYARENGMLIAGLVALYDASGDDAVLADAVTAADWIVAHRALPGGGFSHDEKDTAGPYLGDSLQMFRALMALYGATGERSWLTHARAAADFISAKFADGKNGGYFTADPKTAGFIKPTKLNEDNIFLARLYNLLGLYTGDTKYHDAALLALRELADPNAAYLYVTEIGIVIADSEINSAPLHITIVGAKDDPASQTLFKAAAAYPSLYKRTEWWDKKEGPMPNPDVEYPQLAKPAAFICTSKRCSLPIFAPAGIAATIAAFNKG